MNFVFSMISEGVGFNGADTVSIRAEYGQAMFIKLESENDF